MKCFMRWESLQLMIVCRPTLTLSNNPSRGFCGYQTDLRSLISDVVKYNYVRAIAEKRQWSNTVNSRRNNDFRSRAKLILLEWKYRVLPNALSPNAVKIKLPATNVLQAIVPRWKDTQDQRCKFAERFSPTAISGRSAGESPAEIRRILWPFRFALLSLF